MFVFLIVHMNNVRGDLTGVSAYTNTLHSCAADEWAGTKLLVHEVTSVAVQADTLVRSSRKLFIFITRILIGG